MNKKIMLSTLAMMLFTTGLTYSPNELVVNAQNVNVDSLKLLKSHIGAGVMEKEIELFDKEINSLLNNYFQDKNQTKIKFKNHLENQVTNSELKRLGNETLKVLNKLEMNITQNPAIENVNKWFAGIDLSNVNNGHNTAYISKVLNTTTKNDISTLTYSYSTYTEYISKEILEIFNGYLNFSVAVKKVNTEVTKNALEIIISPTIENYNDAYVMYESLRLLENKGAINQLILKQNPILGDNALINVLNYIDAINGRYTSDSHEHNMRFAEFFEKNITKQISENEFNEEIKYFLGHSLNSKLMINMLVKMKEVLNEDVSRELLESIATNFKEGFEEYAEDKRKVAKEVDGVNIILDKTTYLELDKYVDVDIKRNGNLIDIKLWNKLNNEPVYLNGNIMYGIPVDTYKSLAVKLDENGKENAVSHVYEKGNIIIKSKDGNFIILIKPITDSPFNDISSNFAKNSINFLEQRKLVAGTTGDKFSPSSKINRASFSVMLTRALELKPQQAPVFVDIKGKWFEGGVQALSDAGFIAGASKTKFNPDENLTRQDAAVIITRIFKAYDISPLENKDITTFSDYNEMSNYAKTSIKFISDMGIMGGKSGNKFDPKGQLTRAEMAKILHYSLKELGLY